MKIGDLVRLKPYDNGYGNFYHSKVGVLWAISGPNPIARILWSDGKRGFIHIKFLEVVCK
tara:strand:+ start:1108 stop:1287 length:180 start_codon:yes stop_codon:yes gene_type:complete